MCLNIATRCVWSKHILIATFIKHFFVNLKSAIHDCFLRLRRVIVTVSNNAS